MKRGKVARPFEILGIREVEKHELELLREKRLLPSVQKLRDPHHMLARLIAAGVRPLATAAYRAGYSYNRAHLLMDDPAFQELVASYRADVHATFIEGIDEFTQLATGNMLKAERMIAEKLEEADEAGELLPIRDLMSIRSDSADRFGYGKKQTNLNVNVDFAAQLEKAIKRSGKVIDSTVATTSLPSPQGEPQASPRFHSPEAPRLRRRA